MKYKSILFVFICLIFFSCNNSVESEDQFVQIFFKYGFKNELNTFENTFQKDLVMDGVIRVNFWLTADEQNRILQKAEYLNYFSMPDTFQYIPQPDDTVSFQISPDPGEQILRIKYSTNDKTTIYEPKYRFLVNDDIQFDNLTELRQLIIDIIESKLLYKLLPEPRGAYL